jgi:hypothetical protein
MWARGSVEHALYDNFIFVQVQCLPLRCRGECISPVVATDHQSAKRGSKAVPQNPTENPVEQSCAGTGRRIHGRIVVTWDKPTRIMGYGQNGKDQG